MTPDDIAAMRARHEDHREPTGGLTNTWCMECDQLWPCDAIRALDALEDTVLAARFNDAAYTRSVNADRARAEAAERHIASLESMYAVCDAQRHEAEARLAAVLAMCDRDNPYLGHQRCLEADRVRAAATGDQS